MSQPNSLFIEVSQARLVLERLFEEYPELADNEILATDALEGETNAFELLDELIREEREAKYLSMAVSDEVDRLAERMARFENRRNIIRKYMMQLMEAANLKKAERPAATVSIAAGRPKVVIIDEGLIPPSYHRVKTEIDKESIAKTLKALGEVPGATLSNAEPMLRIS